MEPRVRRRPQPVAIGDVLAGKYVLRARLGDGGMGIVFCAEQPDLDRTVAIKVLHPALAADPTIARSFREEARAASRLHHPNVVTVIDFGETEAGTPFLVMEHVHGGSLSGLIQEHGPLRITRAAALVRQILAALDLAHTSGIVHGDVKSDNVLIEPLRDGDELVKMVDFGLARRSGDAGGGPGARGIVSGTPEYMAPELIAGGGTSVATDVYATGVLLYELVTGETPFAGGDPDTVMARHQHEAVVPPSLRRANLDIPADLERVILQALAKDPGDRFPAARAFAAALRAATPAQEPIRDRHRTATTPPAAGALEAPTRRWSVEAEASPTTRFGARRMARGTPEPEAAVRERLAHAIAHGDIDAIAAGYLTLSRALVSAARIGEAMHELEESVDLLTGGAGPEATVAPGPTWQVLAALACLHDANGDPAAALRFAAAAHRHALICRSVIGADRTRAIIDRLARQPRRPR
ncbi:MAG: serine/threonine protein kinase [Deltaproteobacteria bacterium]|nr:serine/threonine protein kinase [Deltaproteobacteria bacterium]